MAEHEWSDRYRLHNQRGSDGPCDCDECRDEVEAAYIDSLPEVTVHDGQGWRNL